MSEKCPIIAIDPGNRQSAYCVIDCNTCLLYTSIQGIRSVDFLLH